MPDRVEAEHERVLIERARGGDHEAFEALVISHQGAVYRFARSITRDDALAEDVLQETFISALASLPGWRAEAPLRTWLLVIARNAALRHRRREREVPSALERDDELGALGVAAGWGAADDPEQLASRGELRARVGSALALLDDEEREVLVLRDVEAMSGDETAAVLGISLAAMKSRLHRARLRFTAALKRGGFDGG